MNITVWLTTVLSLSNAMVYGAHPAGDMTDPLTEPPASPTKIVVVHGVSMPKLVFPSSDTLPDSEPGSALAKPPGSIAVRIPSWRSVPENDVHFESSGDDAPLDVVKP